MSSAICLECGRQYREGDTCPHCSTTITLVNPWSGAVVERDAADIDSQMIAMLLDDETLFKIETLFTANGIETDAAWIMAYVETVGVTEASRVILGS